jgi:probable HAF family extracellular repeat protein
MSSGTKYVVGLIVLGALAAVLASANRAGAAQSVSGLRYSVTALPQLDDNCAGPDIPRLGGVGLAINDRGQVAGISHYCISDGSYHAVLWSSGTIQDISAGWVQACACASWVQAAQGINVFGAVVGAGGVQQGVFSLPTLNSAFAHAFLHRNGAISDLGTLAGSAPCLPPGFESGPFSGASAINNRGDIVGWSQTTCGGAFTPHAFLYRDGSMRDLGTLGGPTSRATDINDLRVIVGTADTTSGSPHAFRYVGAVMQDLGTLGGTRSTASGVTLTGHVVGTSTVAGDTSEHAFLHWAGRMRDLGTLQGGSSAAYGVNDLLQVVGSSDGRAFVYTNGQMRDLNTLVPAGTPTLTSANAISNKGQIVAQHQGAPYGQVYLLSPVRS